MHMFLNLLHVFIIDVCQKDEQYTDFPPPTEKTCTGHRPLQPGNKCICKKGFTRDILTNHCLDRCPLPGNAIVHCYNIFSNKFQTLL